MSILIVVVHVIVCIALILIVLLQTGKGADMGAAFGGGGSQTLFGATGASTFLSKATTAAAIVFMLTSLTLAYMYSSPGEKRLVTDMPNQEQSQTLPAATEDNAPTTEAQGTDQQPAAQEAAPATQTPAATEEPEKN
jgi:preprotein translocase subunit SecG